MKRLYFSLIAIITFVGFAALALADPGTTWDQQINGQGRFKVLRSSAARLFWTRKPGASGSSRRAQWFSLGRDPLPSSMRTVTATN